MADAQGDISGLPRAEAMRHKPAMAKIKATGPDAAEKPPRAGRGRPSKQNEAIGRDVILAAAKEVMRTVQPAKVTRLAIAKQAGVDPNLVRYYFGTVPELMSEVVLDSHQQIFDALDETPVDSASDWLCFRINEWLAMFLHNPFHHQLLMEVMYADIASDEHEAWTRSLAKSIGYTRSGLERGEKSKELRSVDPRFLQLALLGMTEFFANNGDIIRDMFGEGATPEKLQADYRDFLHDLVINGLKPRG